MILSLYDESGVFVVPWIAGGYIATIVDLQHPEGISREGRLTKIGGDIRQLDLKQFDDVTFVSAFPPCTDLAVSGASRFEKKRKKNPSFQDEAMELVYIAHDIAEHYDVPYLIENPVSVISTMWRKPDYYFHPYEYSGYCAEENYTKKTCLWTNDKFIMPKPNFDPSVPPSKSWVLDFSPSPERKKMRSKTPMGFSMAVFLSNKK
jgi:hypothetical protein